MSMTNDNLPKIKVKYYLNLENDLAILYRKDASFEGYWSAVSNNWINSPGHQFKGALWLPITEKQAYRVKDWQKLMREK